MFTAMARPPTPPMQAAPGPREAFDEKRRRLLDELEEAGLGARIPEIEPLLRDSIALLPHKARAADLAPGACRFGGAPDAPHALDRATVAGWEIDYLGQLDLAVVAPWDVHDKLPREGLLSFFLLREGDETIRGRVLYDLGERGPSRSAAPARKKRKVLGVDFGARVMPPPYNSLVHPHRDVVYESFHDDLREQETVPNPIEGSGMLGYDRANERVLRPDEEILLRLDTENGFDFDFSEAVCLYFILRSSALARRDFDDVRVVLGASI